MTCSNCGAEMPPNFLACPSCHALVHAAELKTLAASAEASAANRKYSEALVGLRRMLELLPAGSSQHNAIKQRVVELSKNIDQSEEFKAPEKPKWGNKGGALGALALVVWKFKFFALLILTKGKLLLLGLTKMSTLSSMAISLWAYGYAFGWQLALGLILCIYVHEMGHIYQLRRYGIPATAPMFIPGLGAMIRLKQYPATPHEDAVTGLAGPVWGLGATVVCYLVYLGTKSDLFAVLCGWNAFINLFNLLPVWQLDGNHGMRGLTRQERVGIAAVFLIMSFLLTDGFLLILGGVSAVRAFQKDVAQKRDLPIFFEYVMLIVALSLFAQIIHDRDFVRERNAADKIAFAPTGRR